jgi:adenylylsulfate kinase-like enzyme
MAKIYWFTGKPGVGKSVLANMLTEFLSTEKRNWRSKVFLINENYFNIQSISDYNQQTQIAQIISEFITDSGCDVVVSLTSPNKKLRDDFKGKLGENVVEFYLNSKKSDLVKFDEYEPPTENFFEIDTTKGNLINSFNKIIHFLGK